MAANNTTEDITVSTAEQTATEATSTTTSTTASHATPQRRYAVVLYASYRVTRPSEAELIEHFSQYGEVDHVKMPVGRNICFIFMNSLYYVERPETTVDDAVTDGTAADTTADNAEVIPEAVPITEQQTNGRRTGGSVRMVIAKMVRDMTPETRYYVTVARSSTPATGTSTGRNNSRQNHLTAQNATD
jgi:hypothetical protein